MSAVWLGPVEPIVLRPTVTTVYCRWCGIPVADCNGYRTKQRQAKCCPDCEHGITMPPVVPSFDEPCEDCDDASYCESCANTGIVQRVWRAEEQCRGRRRNGSWTEWTVACATKVDANHERRLAVVAWYEPTVLPVVDRTALTDDGGEVISFEGGGKGYPVIYRDNGCDEFPTEPWAADLTPGCVVVMPGDEHRIDTPITSMLDPNSTETHVGYDRGQPVSPSLRVSLSLSPGLNDVELAR